MSTPRQVRTRRARHESGSVRSSFLSVPSAVGLDAVGFEIVGDVMGVTVASLSHHELGGCGWRKGDGTPIRFEGARREQRSVPYARQLRDAYGRVATRMIDEARVLGADGVVGIALSVLADEDEVVHEITATGTAVRALSTRRPERPFLTDLSGSDVAALLLGGHVPVRWHLAVEVGVRHDDLDTMHQAGVSRGNRGNNEVAGYVEVRQRVTDRVRTRLAGQIADAGADGALLSTLDVGTWHQHCRLQTAASDHIVRATAIATSIARFGSPRRPRSSALAIMPLSSSAR